MPVTVCELTGVMVGGMQAVASRTTSVIRRVPAMYANLIGETHGSTFCANVWTSFSSYQKLSM